MPRAWRVPRRQVLQAGDAASISSPSIVCRRMRSRWPRRADRPVEDVAIDRELADVVQHRHELDLGRVERIEPQVLGHHAGVCARR